jgi:hypothetical protein
MPGTTEVTLEARCGAGPTGTSQDSEAGTPCDSGRRNPMKVARLLTVYGDVILAGPLTSLLPLGSLTPIVAIFATSFASFSLRQAVLGGICAFLRAGGFNGLQGQILSLLSFMSFSAVFGKLQTSIRWQPTLTIGCKNRSRNPYKAASMNLFSALAAYRQH